MINFRHVTMTYEGTREPTLNNIDLIIPEGELVLVAGRTGSGKSTLLGMINGLVPHFTGGSLRGSVLVQDMSTESFPPRDLAHVVGVVGQDPLAGFVTDTVEEELAYAMEQLAIPNHVMRKRVEETLDLLGIAELRARTLSSLSGGQQQRVAIGAAMTPHPKVLVLDEPTSSLDPTAAEEVLSALTRLVHDLGMTVVIAEHRLERIVQYVDRMLFLLGNGTVVSGSPQEILRDSYLAPPIAHLGRQLSWPTIPLSVREARRLAKGAREQLSYTSANIPPSGLTESLRHTILSAHHIYVRHPGVVAVRDVSLTLQAGEITALTGRNGSGKSSLLWALQGSGPRQSGSVFITPQNTSIRGSDENSPAVRIDPAKLRRSHARKLIGLVPQTPSDLLYLNTVEEECNQADLDAGRPHGTCRALLDRITPSIPSHSHPRDLSEGQKLSLVLAIQLAAEPQIILLDEPTRGLDYESKAALSNVLSELAKEGHSIVIATHDVEFVATTTHRVLVMASGELIADDTTRAVLSSSPAFAPQVARVFSPVDVLTVEEAVLRLEDSVP